MLNILPLLDLTKLLVGLNPRIKPHGNVLYIPLYSASARFVCASERGTMHLQPLTLRMAFDKPATSPFTTTANLLAASITCSTRQSIHGLAGAQVALGGENFELYGRLRRSRHNAYFKTLGSSLVTLSISSVLSPHSCQYCEAKPSHGVVSPASCLSCRVTHLKPLGRTTIRKPLIK